MQTVTVSSSHINHRLLAVLVAAVLMAVLVTLAVAHYVHGSSARSIPPAPAARLAPISASSFRVSSCPAHRPC
jgi:hypothetical protein